ncbi:MAG: hypothetical protein ACE5J6_00705 [Candidatus Bathyarchaeia archaeon]
MSNVRNARAKIVWDPKAGMLVQEIMLRVAFTVTVKVNSKL